MLRNVFCAIIIFKMLSYFCYDVLAYSNPAFFFYLLRTKKKFPESKAASEVPNFIFISSVFARKLLIFTFTCKKCQGGIFAKHQGFHFTWLVYSFPREHYFDWYLNPPSLLHRKHFTYKVWVGEIWNQQTASAGFSHRHAKLAWRA